MKRMLTGTVLALTLVASLATAEELKPIVKIMRARIAWVTSMTTAFVATDMATVKADASALAAQAQGVAEKAQGPARDANIMLATAARSVAAAADRGDAAEVKAGLANVIGVCNSCHTKVKDAASKK